MEDPLGLLVFAYSEHLLGRDEMIEGVANAGETVAWLWAGLGLETIPSA